MSINKIGIELTDRCNSQCIHCLRTENPVNDNLPQSVVDKIYSHKKYNDISVDIIKKIIEDAKPYNIPVVAFTGGEPTLHPQFEEIIKLFCNAGYKFHFITNGSRFERVFQQVNPYLKKMNGISFSLDSAEEKINDNIRGKGSYRRTMKAISICKMKKIPMTIQMTIMTINRHGIEEMASTASKLGCAQLFLLPLQITPQTVSRNLMIPPDDWNMIKSEIAKLTKIYKIKIMPSMGFPLKSGWIQCEALNMTAFYIDNMGNLTFCCQLSGYGDYSAQKDIIADLNNESLIQGHIKLVDKIAEFQKFKLNSIAKNDMSNLDYFPCYYCTKYFEKIGWLKHFPESLWNQ